MHVSPGVKTALQIRALSVARILDIEASSDGWDCGKKLLADDDLPTVQAAQLTERARQK